MKFLILTVLLSVPLTAAPIPRQARDSSTQTSHSRQNQAKDKNGPFDPSLSNVGRSNSKSNEGDRNDHRTNNAENPISIRELPPVTINSHRDWADWGTWLFTLLLALTSGLQVWLLINSGKQTERIITQMKETEVRDLRAYVGVSRILLRLNNPQVPEALVEIQNFGKTPANKVRHSTGIGIQSYPPSAPLPEVPQPERASVTIMFPQVKNLGKVSLQRPLPPNVPLGTPQITVYVYGTVIYEDVFGNQRYSNFRFLFGGPESGVTFYDDNQILCGAVRPDSEGNDAT